MAASSTKAELSKNDTTEWGIVSCYSLKYPGFDSLEVLKLFILQGRIRTYECFDSQRFLFPDVIARTFLQLPPKLHPEDYQNHTLHLSPIFSKL